MTGKSKFFVGITVVALLAAAPAAAHDPKVEILRGIGGTTEATADTSVKGLTVLRGSVAPAAALAAPVLPVATIDGLPVKIGSLEPASDWFIDRSGDRLVLVHCYTRQTARADGGRRILCDARQF